MKTRKNGEMWNKQNARMHLWWFKRIVRRKVYGDKKHSTCIWTVSRTHDCRLPVKHVFCNWAWRHTLKQRQSNWICCGTNVIRFFYWQSFIQYIFLTKEKQAISFKLPIWMRNLKQELKIVLKIWRLALNIVSVNKQIDLLFSINRWQSIFSPKEWILAFLRDW